MAARRLEIAVAGCGVAGLAAALFLARAGFRVTLFDQLEHPAPVGSGLLLQPAGLAVLGALGLERTVAQLGCRIDALQGRAMPSGRTVLDVSYAALGENVHARAIHRAALFNTLFGAVAAENIPLETGCRVASLDMLAGSRIALLCEGGRRFGPFDLVIDALGVRSPLSGLKGGWLPFGALWVNVDRPGGDAFPAHALAQRYRRAAQMAGVLPIGRPHADGPDQCAFFWSLKADDFERWRTQPLDAWRAEVAELWPQAAALVAPIAERDAFIFARYRHGVAPRTALTGVIAIGDAAHATSPQLGQGANMALLDALALADALGTTGTIEAAQRRYYRHRAFHIALYQALSFAFTPLYQSDSHILPLLRDTVLAPLQRVPPVPRILAALVCGAMGLRMPPIPGA